MKHVKYHAVVVLLINLYKILSLQQSECLKRTFMEKLRGNGTTKFPKNRDLLDWEVKVLKSIFLNLKYTLKG